MRDQTSVGQCNLFDTPPTPTPAAVMEIAAVQPRSLFTDPGPVTGKMAGKGERKIASTRPYHAAPGPFRAPASRERPGDDVTESGPHRYFLRDSGSDRRQVIDRQTGATVDEGPWLNMWGLALRMNGINLFAAEVVS